MNRRAVLAVCAMAWLAMAAMGPAAARTALDEVFPDGLPFPFERVLERLRAEAGADAVRTALIPLGRSLQRHSASPGYYASPRIVVAVSGDRAGGPEMPRLADRLYLGYVPAAAVVEAISYDETAGRFEFQQVVGYGLDASWRTESAERSICLRCHQGEGPIFARPLWSETNANPAVAARLEGLGPAFHGAPVRQMVDALDAFDASTDRAAGVAVANRLWAEGCPDAPCRAALFVAAMRFGLNGARAGWRAGESPAQFDDRTARLWPNGLAVVSPDLPNRDPAPMLVSADPGSLLDAAGTLAPETPREHVVLWRGGPEAYDESARAIAAMLAPGDFEWMDELLRAREAPGRFVSLACAIGTAPLEGADEIRFDCRGEADRAEGFLRPGGSGRIDRLTIDGADVPARIPVRAHLNAGTYRMQAVGPAPRLPDGARIGTVELSGSAMRLEILDDFGPFAAALRARAREVGAALGDGPFRRRALLTLVAEVAGGENG